tara:strand:+ start:54 stop:212 length:159 start_codon:yes stop_codon:yes gene_type:complete
MIIPFTLLFGAVGYLFYRSKEEVSLLERDQLESQTEEIEEDDLYKELGDLFI